MPNVPVYSSASVEPIALPGVRQQTPYRMMQAATLGPSETLAAGRAMLSAGKELAQEATLDQIHQNETQAKTFDTKHITSNDAVLYGADNPDGSHTKGFMDMQGQDAIDAYEATKKKLKDIPVSLGDGLQNPAQQQLVANTSELRTQGAMNQVESHYQRQVKVANDAASDARRKTASDSATRSFDPVRDTPQLNFDQENPEKNSMYQQSLQTVVSSTRDLWAHMPQEVIDQKVKEALSNTYIDTIEKLANGRNSTPADSASAKAYFESVKGQLSADQEAKVKRVLDQGDLQDRSLALSIEVGGKFQGIAAQEKELKRRFSAGEIKADVYKNALVELRQDDDQRRQQATEADRQFMGKVWNMARQGKTINDLTPSEMAYATSRNLGTHIDQYFNYADHNKNDAQIYVDQMRMASEDPSGFVKQNLALVRGQLTEAHWNHLVGVQNSINKNDVKAMDTNKIIHQAVGDAKAELKTAGFDLNAKPNTTAAKNLAAFESTLRDSLVAAQTGWDEKKLTPQQQREEARKITFGLLKDQALAGTQTIPIIGSNTHKRVLNMTPEERRANWVIPDTERSAIADSLRRKNEPVTEDKIQQIYKLSQGVMNAQ